jgi:hypothetical protein
MHHLSTGIGGDALHTGPKLVPTMDSNASPVQDEVTLGVRGDASLARAEVITVQ